MYLTRFRINTARRGARRLLSSPQTMHAAVLSSFAEPAPAGGGARVLWRVDGTGHQQVLYIVSPTEPDLTHLVEQAGWPTTESWDTRKYGDFLARLRSGQRWAFRLTANPAHSGRLPHAKDTKRIGHVTVEQQRQWLLTRATRAGFRILPAGPDSSDADVIIHKRQTYTFSRGGGRVTLRVATFDGQLEVADADALRAALAAGIGHGKAYGCGLLTLAAPR